MSTAQMLSELKAAGQDFEWYPTTNEIIQKVAIDIKLKFNRSRNGISVLDIGAGDGRALIGIRSLCNAESDRSWESVSIANLFAIEKSTLHIANMPKDIVVIGTDFHEQTLVDKPADVVFCNPPYSEYESWMFRILTECPCKYAYLVVPKRWRGVKRLIDLVDNETIQIKPLGEFDFESADRQARACVEVIRFKFERNENSEFDAAIEAMLPELSAFDLPDDLRTVNSKEALNEMCVGNVTVIGTLVAAYDAELAEMLEAYRSIAKMNVQLLKELGVSKQGIKDGLRLKIQGLKDKYWSVLFGHLDDIRKRLASKQRKKFLESLTGKGMIDFTESNIYSMLVWISKWASDHFDTQIVELFKSLAQKATVERYKSNSKVFREGNWRYLHEDESHYKLCYRLVLETHGGIHEGRYSWESHNGLANSTHDLLSDFITVANNLGFECSDDSRRHQWSSGRKVELVMRNGVVLMDVRAFKNGNIHIRVDKKVMLAINVQAGKLLGWLRTAHEATAELDAEDNAKFVSEAFAKSNAIQFHQVLRIGR